MLLHKILRIIDSNGNLVVKYKYNAFRNIFNIFVDITLGNKNSFKWKRVFLFQLFIGIIGWDNINANC